jgi:outer membrane protein OmpA-like peptidoglycan-associated protein
MKFRYLLSLPLAASLIVPAAFAQQDNSSSSSQTAPASQQVAPAPQSTEANGPNTNNSPELAAHQPLKQDTHEGFWGHLNPFARKKYVQRQMTPIRDRMNELDELTAANAKNIKDVDSRAQEGIRQASAKADTADQHAIDAGNRAQAAQQTIQQASTRLNTVQQTVGSLDQYQPVSDTEIRFRPGQQTLSPKAKEALDQIADAMKSQRGYVVAIQGFASGRGKTAISNSQGMADSVVRYLVINHDVPLYRIYTVGLGNVPAKETAEGTPQKRIRGGRVEISLLKNGIGDLAATNGSQPSGASTNGAVTGSVNQNATPAVNQQPATGNAQPANNSQNNSGSTIPRE